MNLPVFENPALIAGFCVFISLFAIICAVHLYFCFKMIPKWRKLTKPFCLIFLGGAMAFLVPKFPLVYISCFLSAVGDILLIKNKTPLYFVTGAIVFASAHTLNALNQITLLDYKPEWYIYLIVAVLIVVVGVVGYLARGKQNAAAASVGASYACFHILNIILSIMVLSDNRGIVGYEVLILMGYLIYVVSDLVVNYVTNKRDINRRDFYIMLTYLSGQSCIYFGLAFALSAI